MFLNEYILGWIPSSPAAAPGTAVLQAQHAGHGFGVAQIVLPCRGPSFQPSWADRVSQLLESVLAPPGPVSLNLGDEVLIEGLARAARDAGVQVGTAVGTACHDRCVSVCGCVTQGTAAALTDGGLSHLLGWQQGCVTARQLHLQSPHVKKGAAVEADRAQQKLLHLDR